MDFWGLVPDTVPDAFWVAAWSPEIGYTGGTATTWQCDGLPDRRCMFGDVFGGASEPNGTYQFLAFEFHVGYTDGDPYKPTKYSCDV